MGPNEMHIVRSSDLPAVPWRNGGGLTREVASASDDNGLVWRISLADVTAEGPFSAFEGFRRILTVIGGEGMRYERPGLSLDAPPLTPVRFEGAPPVEGRLPHGPVRNVNLSYRPDAVDAEVRVLVGPQDLALAVAPGGTLVLHAVVGGVEVAGRPLPAGMTAFATETQVALTSEARVVAITLNPRPGARPLSVEIA